MHKTPQTFATEPTPLAVELARFYAEDALGSLAPLAQQEFLSALMLTENSIDTYWILNELLNPLWTVSKLTSYIASCDNMAAREYGKRYQRLPEREMLELVWQVSARLYQRKYGLKKP